MRSQAISDRFVSKVQEIVSTLCLPVLLWDRIEDFVPGVDCHLTTAQIVELQID
jgi:hypothetical protein|tara:strand:+ start:542 stop:703 length:162 start_codon:yes stop_codon:yes gene_type:complete